eukprot:7387955-Prymnesium_polylepis.1
MQLIEKEKEPNWNHFGCGNKRPLWENASQKKENLPSEFPERVCRAYQLYEKNVLKGIELAFQNDHRNPHMETLHRAAEFCGLEGSADFVLKGLAPHVEHRIAMLWKKRQIKPSIVVDKQNDLDHQRLVARMKKAWGMLRRPEERIKKQFDRSALPPDVQLTEPAQELQALELQAPPALAVATTATATAPSAPCLARYLRGRVLPRADCAKCEVARGTDASVRECFASEGGKGHVRDPSLKRACPLAAHAISAAGDGVPLVEAYEREYGVKIPNKKQKFVDYMKLTFGVDRLGKPPSYKVTLYTPPCVTTDVSVEGDTVKLDLVANGFKKTSEQGTKDNFMGFQVI